MHLSRLCVKSNIKPYDALFEEDDSFIKNLAHDPLCVFVVDENVWIHYKDSALWPLPADRVIIQPVCEEKKTIDSVLRLYAEIMKFAPKKNLKLVSIGGGIVQDITGFVASTLYRGVHWVFVPTTLLAQVDSCIGAKTSLNFQRYKNLIGSFYPPARIHIYPEFLRTLNRMDYYSGMGEMAKLHIMDGPGSTEAFVKALPELDRLNPGVLLERIRKCLEIKKEYIENDEFDTGRRNMLNYGHCFGHALETATDYAISHGQAVVVGMILANEAATRRGILSAEQNAFIKENVLSPSLKHPLGELLFDVDRTIEAMGQDKKNTGKGLALVMLKDGHEMFKITDLQPAEAKRILGDFKQRTGHGSN